LLDRVSAGVICFIERDAIIQRLRGDVLGKQQNRGMGIPSKGECLDLMKRYNGMGNIIRHCIKVAEIALSISTELNRRGENLNLNVVEAAALLHDITKAESLDSGEDHSLTGYRLLRKMGYNRIAEIVREHVFLLKDTDSPRVSEEEVVNYSDKRVRHDQIVTLRERFDDLRVRYCKDQGQKKWMDRLEALCYRIENKICSKLDIDPEELIVNQG
jgi:putative nucleotidyltransferase with HDIG domain